MKLKPKHLFHLPVSIQILATHNRYLTLVYFLSLLIQYLFSLFHTIDATIAIAAIFKDVLHTMVSTTVIGLSVATSLSCPISLLLGSAL